MYLYIYNDIYIYIGMCIYIYNLQYYNGIYIQYTGIYMVREREEKKRNRYNRKCVSIYIYTHTYIYIQYTYIHIYTLQNCGMYQVIYQGNVMG
jgi:hypothetical protein